MAFGAQWLADQVDDINRKAEYELSDYSNHNFSTELLEASGRRLRALADRAKAVREIYELNLLLEKEQSLMMGNNPCGAV